MERLRHAITEPVNGYRLTDRWSVVVAQESDVTNLVTNPSVETSTTGYTAVGGSIARVVTKQRRGAYSLEVTPTAGTSDGVYFGTISTVADTLYAWEFDFFGTGGVKYKAYWATTGGVQVGAAVSFKGTGKWKRITVPYGETSTTTRRLYIIKDGSASTAVFYVDGMLAVNCLSQLTSWKYFDGDTKGFSKLLTEFYWTGTPHESASVMRAHTRAGGRVIPLTFYGFTLLGVIGGGLPSPNNVSTPLALPGGAYFQRTITPTHSFDIVGTLAADTPAQLRRNHRDLIKAVDASRYSRSQPMYLIYEPLDDSENPIGETLEIACSYAGGLEGQRDNLYQENLSLRFEVYLPYAASLYGTGGASLDVRDDIADANNILWRSRDGIWQAAEAGTSVTVADVLWMPDGRLLLAGNFTNVGGDGDADRLVYYDPITNTTTAINATPLNGIVRTLLLLPDGNVLVGGDFTDAGGDTDADRLCLLTVSTGAYSALNATPLNDAVRALELLPDGTVAVGGTFTDAGGDGDADFLCRLTLSTGAYSAFTTSPLLNASVLTLETDAIGHLWIGGNFTNVASQAYADYLTVLGPPDYDTFSPVDVGGVQTPLSDAVNVILALTNGKLLVGGAFTSVLGDADWDSLLLGTYETSVSLPTVLFAEKWFGGLNGSVSDAHEYPAGTVWVSGGFTMVGGISITDRWFKVTGNTIEPIDLVLPSGSVSIVAIDSRPGGEFAIGFAGTGTAYTSGTSEISNEGSADAFPIIVIEYDTAATVVASLYSIRNLTTSQVLSFSLTLIPGETLTIDLRPGKKKVTSDVRGDLTGTLLPGSPLAAFKLSPGTNVLNIFVDIAAATNVSAYVYWVPNYSSVEDATY